MPEDEADKAGLTKKMRQERLNWCLALKDWTLNDGRMPFGLMRLLSFYCIAVAATGFGAHQMKPASKAVSMSDGKDTQNLCSGVVFRMRRKAPAIAGALRLQRRKISQKRKSTRLNEELEPIYKEQWKMSTAMRRLNLC